MKKISGAVFICGIIALTIIGVALTSLFVKHHHHDDVAGSQSVHGHMSITRTHVGYIDESVSPIDNLDEVYSVVKRPHATPIGCYIASPEQVIQTITQQYQEGFGKNMDIHCDKTLNLQKTNLVNSSWVIGYDFR